MHILKNRLFVLKKETDSDQLQEFRYVVYDKQTEENVLIETFESIGRHYSFSRGNIQKIHEIWDEDDIDDQRDVIPFPEKYKLKFLGDPLKSEEEKLGYKDLRKEQRRVLKDWIAAEYGMIQAPPRWGKSIWLVALCTLLKQRTLILAHTTDLVSQLEEEFRAWTNINEMEEDFGKQLIGKLGTTRKKTFYPLITLSTWQYLHMNKKILANPKNKIGFVAVDEAHRSSAECFTSVVNSTNSKLRLGISATPELKSGLHVIAFDVIGPVVAVGREEQLSVDIKIHFTEETYNSVDGWTKIITQLANTPSRDSYIAEQVIKDVNEDRFVLVTTDRVSHCLKLQKMLWSKDRDLSIAVITGTTSGTLRKKIRDQAKNGELDVVIGMNKIIQEGWNVPRLSSLHNTMPMVNAGNWYQRISRTRTVYIPINTNDTYVKPKPVCHIYVDDFGKKGAGIKYGYINCVKNNAEENNFNVTYIKKQDV